MSLDAFSSIDQVVQCMVDVERSSAFQRAIREVVKPGMRVLDVGTGTGLLALFAAQAGADQVVALEYDPYIANVARELVLTNGLQQKVKVITADATTAQLSSLGRFDAVVMELLTTGMIDELQVPAFNHLIACKIVDQATKVVPERVTTKAQLVSADFNLLGLNMRVIRHLWFDFPASKNTRTLSKEVVVDDVMFNTSINPTRKVELPVQITNEGTVNAIYLRSITHLSQSVSIEDTMTLNAPVIIPLSHDLPVTAGSELMLQLSFRAGAGFQALKISVDSGAACAFNSAA